MSEAAIVIVSPHADFALTLAEQVKAELGLACAVAEDFSQLTTASLIVTTEDISQPLGCSVVFVRKKPIRMCELLSDIVQMRLQHLEDIALGGGVVLKVRLKQLHSEGNNIDLTDKEVSIIQNLISVGGEGLSREQLLKKVWGFDSSLDTHTLETHIYRLRNKIRELSGQEALISATPGGYAIVLK